MLGNGGSGGDWYNGAKGPEFQSAGVDGTGGGGGASAYYNSTSVAGSDGGSGLVLVAYDT